MYKKIFVLGVLALGGLAVEAGAQQRASRLVVAFPPGGPVDFVARVMSDELGKELGQPVIIENKAGASGAIGAAYVANGPADGSLMFLTSLGAVVLNPMLYKQLPYDAAKDFAAVSLVIVSPTVLVVNPSTNAKDAVDLVKLSKAAQKPFSIGSAGLGGTTHIAYEMFVAASGANFLHVPYKGAGPVITDLLASQVGGFFGDLPGLIGNIKGGKLRPLGILAGKRHPLVPDVPTMAELGFKGIESENWYAIVVQSKTPREIIGRMNAAIRKTLAAESVRTRLLASGAEIIPSSPEEAQKRIADDKLRWGQVISSRKITVD